MDRPAPAQPPASPNPAAVPDPVIVVTRWLAVGSVLGLILLGLLWELWLAPLRPGGTWLAIKVLPLCLPLAGLLRHRMYTYRWMSLVVWIYFTEGVVRAWSDNAASSRLALIEVALCIVLFAACAVHVRLRLRRASAPGGSLAEGRRGGPDTEANP